MMQPGAATLRAVAFHGEIRAGSSLPLLVGASDGRRYVLKARGSGDGVLSGVVDWLALGLGARLGIPVLEPRLVRIGPGFEEQAEDPEIRELIGRSHGLNFATPYVEGARPPDAAELARLDPGALRDLFLFDLLLLNVDRHARNPNAIVGEGGFRVLDFSSAMALRALVTGAPVREAALLEQIRRNPFYSPDLDPGPFAERARAVPRGRLRERVEELPAGWLDLLAPGTDPGEFRSRLTDGLATLLDGAAALGDRLEALRGIRPETDEARLRRSQANRDDFRRRFGRL